MKMTAEIIPFPTREVNVYETCVSCHELTNIRKDTSIESRKHYVECVGQLHPKCYNKIYSPENIKESEKIMPKLMKILREGNK